MKKIISTCIALMVSAACSISAFAMEVPTNTTIQDLNGVRQYIKIYTVAPDTDPQSLIDDVFEYDGYTYQVSAETFDVTLEYAGQIIKLAAYNKPAELGVTLTKTGIKEVLAGSKMSYRFTIANTSNVDLQNFYFHDKIPYDVTTASALTTGTYNARLTYRILYKTNYNDYRVLASNLLSTNNYSFGLSGLQLMAGEVVTDIYFDFGTVPSGFQSVTKPTLMVSVNPRTANKYYVTNRADAGGKFGETWQSANASWITIVRNLTPVRKPLLPKTGY